jgi:hypothetical protein
MKPPERLAKVAEVLCRAPSAPCPYHVRDAKAIEPLLDEFAAQDYAAGAASVIAYPEQALAEAWDEGWAARAEFADRRDVPVTWPDLNPYRAEARDVERIVRTEGWAFRDEHGERVAIVDVRDDETVIVSYELLAQMLTDLGGEKDYDAHATAPLSDAQPERESDSHRHGNGAQNGREDA